ncbi:hypothetical protein [Terriglobus albidus]|uniref:hypothetical protein n=1 Tax=Terriglobus albidus TaxID=1592106 RepID=UPI0021E0F257|nr:hypothetical protein [Terriglobus albidus]
MIDPELLIRKLWAVSCVVEAAALLTSIRSKTRSLPLSIYLAVHFTWNIALLFIDRATHSHLYFYFYWYGRLAIFGLECWALASLLDPVLTGIKYLNQNFRTAFMVLLLSASSVCWYVAIQVPSRYQNKILRITFAAERGLVTSEAMLLMCLLAIGSAMAFRWDKFTVWTLGGFTLGMLESLVSGALLPNVNLHSRDITRIAIQIMDCVIFALWLYAFSYNHNQRSEESEATDVSDADEVALEGIPT